MAEGDIASLLRLFIVLKASFRTISLRYAEPCGFCFTKAPQVQTLFTRINERPRGHSFILAERTGFEPAVRLLAHTLSKRAPSTTRPSLH